ncbi:lariat debranching enzyme [Sarracenia purpurea var. burkii]
MKIAVEGCMHGDLDSVYATLLHLQETEKTKIDLLICCGDFQAVRNEKDLESLNVKPKYRSMNSFWKYYSGEKVAPFPTIFIGGNHEASNYLWELYYGGWAAPDIYFLGFAGVVKFGNIRIGGLSGIYKARDYHLGWSIIVDFNTVYSPVKYCAFFCTLCFIIGFPRVNSFIA